MRYLSIIILVAILTACSQSHTTTEKNVVVNNDTVSKVEINIGKTDTVLNTKPYVLLMKLRGSEPGWYGEVYADHLRLLLDYGKDSVSISHNFDSSLSTKGFVASLCISETHKLKQQDVSLTLDIIGKSCIESASGDKRERTVNLTLNKKIYKGCGELVINK
jgi:uncharacterized membrane protein